MAVNIRILADFDAKGFKQAEQAIGDLGRTAGRVLGGLAIGAGVAAVGAIREFGNFDAALTKSLAIMGDVTDTMRGEMSQAARDVAKTTTFSAEQAAESFFFLASAGLDAEASMKALPQVAAFAQAGMFDMARATDLLTDAQSALGLTIRDDAVANMENMIRVSDVLVKGNILANASVEQFSEALTTKAGAAMRELSIDIEEGVAVLAAFADQGIKGQTAGTQLSIVLRDLTSKAINNKEEFEKFGISVFNAEGNIRNLGDIIGNLETALDGMSDETRKATLLQLGFSDKSLASLQALMGTSEAIKGYEAELRKAGGTTEDVAGRQLDTLNAQLELLKSEFIDVAISVGEQMTPAVRDLVERVKELLPEMGERLVAALEKIDFAKIAEDVVEFTVAIVENIDEIIEMAKQVVIAAGVIFAFTTALKIATTAQAIFTAVAMKNPYVIIALAAVTAGIAIANAVAQTNDQKRALEQQAEATGRTVDEQKEYNTQLETYLRMQENVRQGINNGSMATRQFSADTVGLINELNRAETIRFDNLRSEFRKVQNEALQTRYAASLVNEELRMIRQFGGRAAGPPPNLCSHGIDKDTCPIHNFTPNAVQRTINAAIVSPVEDSLNRLRETVRRNVTDIAQVFTGAFDITKLDRTQGIISSANRMLARMRAFAAELRKLAQQGLHPELLQQVMALGPEQGLALARDLSAGGGMIVTGLNEAFGEVRELGISTGAAIARTPSQVNYTINVNAGVGDRRTIGAAVVEAIQTWERSNGQSWRA